MVDSACVTNISISNKVLLPMLLLPSWTVCHPQPQATIDTAWSAGLRPVQASTQASSAAHTTRTPCCSVSCAALLCAASAAAAAAADGASWLSVCAHGLLYAALPCTACCTCTPMGQAGKDVLVRLGESIARVQQCAVACLLAVHTSRTDMPC